MTVQTSESQSGDAFEDPLIRIILVVLILVSLAVVVGLAVADWGDEYAVPSWNEHSVPPPSI